MPGNGSKMLGAPFRSPGSPHGSLQPASHCGSRAEQSCPVHSRLQCQALIQFFGVCKWLYRLTPFTAHTLSGKGKTSRAHLMLGMGNSCGKSIRIVHVVFRKMEAVGPPPGARLCLPGQSQPDSGSLMNRARKGKEKR